jgi:AraC-like DNA-binding protein
VDESFVIGRFEYTYFPVPWHYHQEVELLYIRESYGTRFIGNRMQEFKAGDFVLIGQNVPHLYRNEDSFYGGEHPERARSQVLHFLPESLGSGFLELPESVVIKKLLKRSQLGLDIKGRANNEGKKLFDRMFDTHGLHRWVLLVELLLLLAESDELQTIAQESMALSGLNPSDTDRLGRVFEYVFINYKRDIRLSEVAELISLTESSFSRYFKQRTKKNFMDFLTEVRLNEACKLLVNNNATITEICYESGFNNISNFNRHFKKHYGLNPRTYQKQFTNTHL